MIYLILALSALLASSLGVMGMRHWALHRKFLDIPNERSSHIVPTPRGGGLVIALITLLGTFVYWLYEPLSLSYSALGGYLLGALLIGGVSWIDDLRSVPSAWRLGVHVLGALSCIVGAGYWHTLITPLGTIELGWIGFLTTLLWLVGLTNAYNFMDGIDGMTGAQAVLAGAGWTLLAWLTTQPLLIMLALLVSASSLGFLVHNWSPASIFMGDVGSAFLGYTFAAIAVLASQAHPSLMLSGAVLQWLFIFDTGFTLLRRVLRGENVFTAHRSHLYQRLVIAGDSHRAVSTLYTLCGALGILVALAWAQTDPPLPLAVSLIPIFCLGLWLWVNAHEHRRLRAIYEGAPETDGNVA